MEETRTLFARRLSQGRLIALDCLAAWGLTLAFLVSAAPGGAPLWAKAVVSLGLGGPLALRRRWPVAVFVLVTAVAVVAMSAQLVTLPFVAPAYALYSVAITRGGGWRVPTGVLAALAAVATLGLVVAGAPAWWSNDLREVLFGVAALGGTWTVGRAVRDRRIFAARDAELLAGQAVTEERLRIAREMHDVVAHSMGLIAVKAGVANHVMRSRPQEAHDALRVIETASRSALVEMRQLLGVLRSEGEEPGLGPAPGVEGLAGLAERAALAGVEVDLDVRGEMPPGVGLSVYRIVQEALTNVVKHAAPARCRVVVEADGRQVRVEVTDDGPGRRVLPGRGGGHGLIGMRERVMMYGGALEAGPGPVQGFRVHAYLPYGDMS